MTVEVKSCFLFIAGYGKRYQTGRHGRRPPRKSGLHTDINQPIRRFHLDDILAAECEISEIESSVTLSTYRCGLNGQFQVSSDGNYIVGPKISTKKSRIGEITKESFQSRKMVTFTRVHSKKINTVALLESRDRCFSFGNDGLVGVYEWRSTEVVTTVDLQCGPIVTSRVLGNLILIGSRGQVLVMDSASCRIRCRSGPLDCEYVYALNYSFKRAPCGEERRDRVQLICGGNGSSKLYYQKIKAQNGGELESNVAESKWSFGANRR